MFTCMFCNTTFGKVKTMNGHMAHCKSNPRVKGRVEAIQSTRQGTPRLKVVQDHVEYVEEFCIDEQMEIQQMEIQPYNTNENHFIVNYYLLNFQNEIKKKCTLEHVSLGKVKLLSGKYSIPDMEVYLELIRYVSTMTKLSEHESSELIKMIKIISARNGKEVPLPSR